jgi:Rod binding domain-containing protein
MAQDPKKRLKQAATALEGIWLSQMMREARPKAGMLDKSFASQTFKDMLDQSMGDSMAKTGVLGLAEKMVQQFSAQHDLSSSHPNSQPTVVPTDSRATGDKGSAS